MGKGGNSSRQTRKRYRPGKKDKATINCGFWSKAKVLAERYMGFGNCQENSCRYKKEKFDNSRSEIKLLAKNIRQLEWKMNLIEEVTRSQNLNSFFGELSDRPIPVKNCLTDFGTGADHFSVSKGILATSNEQHPPIISYSPSKDMSFDSRSVTVNQVNISTETSYEIVANNSLVLMKWYCGVATLCNLPATSFATIYYVSTVETYQVLYSQVYDNPSDLKTCCLTYEPETKKIVIEYTDIDNSKGRVCLKELDEELQQTQADLIGRIVCYLLGLLPHNNQAIDQSV